MGTRERRQREAGQRRASILDAARRLFFTGGYLHTTMPAIAAAAELAPGTLYLYFPSKEALYTELLLEGYDLLRQRLAKHVSPDAAPLRQAAALVDAFYDFAREYPEYFDIMFFVLRREGDQDKSNLLPEQVARLKEGEAQCKAVAAEVLRRADAAPTRQLPMTVEALWAMLAGVIFYFRGDREFAAVASQAKRLILKAVFGT